MTNVHSLCIDCLATVRDPKYILKKITKTVAIFQTLNQSQSKNGSSNFHFKIWPTNFVQQNEKMNWTNSLTHRSIDDTSRRRRRRSSPKISGVFIELLLQWNRKQCNYITFKHIIVYYRSVLRTPLVQRAKEEQQQLSDLSPVIIILVRGQGRIQYYKL